MTLNQLQGGKAPEGFPPPPTVKSVEDFQPQEPRTQRKPTRTELPSAGGNDSYVGSVEAPGEDGYNPVAIYQKGARAVIAKATEGLDEMRKQKLNEVLRQVGELGTDVFSQLKNLILARTQTTVPPFATFVDNLSTAAGAAQGAGNPDQALRDLVTGLGVVPTASQDQYLQAAAGVFAAETAALDRAAAGDVPAPVAVDPSTGTYAAAESSVSVKVDFSLFFQVSARTSERASTEGGDGGAAGYYEATQSVSAKFASDLSISIETMGGYLETADVLSKVDPALFEDFNAAAAGLAEFDDDSLAKFVEAAKALFGALDEATGDTDALDAVGAEIAATAESFVKGVRAAVEGKMPGLDLAALFDEAEASAGTEAAKIGTADLLKQLAEGLKGADPEEETIRSLIASLTAAENARAAQAEAPKLDAADEILAALEEAGADSAEAAEASR